MGSKPTWRRIGSVELAGPVKIESGGMSPPTSVWVGLDAEIAGIPPWSVGGLSVTLVFEPSRGWRVTYAAVSVSGPGPGGSWFEKLVDERDDDYPEDGVWANPVEDREWVEAAERWARSREEGYRRLGKVLSEAAGGRYL